MSRKLHIDTLDKRILTLLMKDVRMPFVEVARQCNVTGSAIHQRVQKLIENGVIDKKMLRGIKSKKTREKTSTEAM